jgi:hypothetical protein
MLTFFFPFYFNLFCCLSSLFLLIFFSSLRLISEVCANHWPHVAPHQASLVWAPVPAEGGKHTGQVTLDTAS